MKYINVNRKTFLKFGDFLQRKGHMDKEFDNRLIKNIDSNSIFLTFDFCPSKEIDQPIIDWLIENKIKATFFINADWMSINSEKDMSFIDNPLFTIGAHGFKHIDPLEESNEEQLKDINFCLKFWKSQRKEIKWYRVPYGHFTDFAIQELNKRGINCASWSGPVLDKKSATFEENVAEQSKNYIEKYLKSGDILVAHANGEGINTLKTLKLIKKLADKRGLSFDYLK